MDDRDELLARCELELVSTGWHRAVARDRIRRVVRYLGLGLALSSGLAFGVQEAMGYLLEGSIET